MYPLEFSGITLKGIYIHEPGGLISDAIIVLLSIAFLFRIGKPHDPFSKYWTLFILFIGIGGLGGTLIHGFPTLLGPKVFYWVWAAKNAFVPAANLCAAYIVLALVYPARRSIIRIYLWLKMSLIVIALFATYSFLPAVIDLAITYIIVLVLASRLKKTNRAFIPIFQSFVIAILSGPIYLIKYDIHPLWLSHKDAVHIFIFINLYLIFRAVLYQQKKYARIDV